jgi:hypothetical protein
VIKRFEPRKGAGRGEKKANRSNLFYGHGKQGFPFRQESEQEVEEDQRGDDKNRMTPVKTVTEDRQAGQAIAKPPQRPMEPLAAIAAPMMHSRI